MNLVFDRVAPGGPGRDAERLAVPRTAIARAMRAIEPHVDEAHRPRSAAAPGRLDDLLFGVATAVLLVVTLLPPSGLGLHAATLGL